MDDSASVKVSRLPGRLPSPPRISALYALNTGATPVPVSVVLGACVIVLAVLYLGQATIGVIPQDEGELLTYPWLIARGAVPYRDIWMMYPPTTYLAIAGLLKLGAPALIAERGLGLAARLLFVALVNRSITGSVRRVSWLAVIGTLAALFLASADMRAYPWIVGMPFAFLGVSLLPGRPLWSAAAFIVAGSLRYEYAAIGIVAFLAVSATSLVRRDVRRDLASGLLVLLAGTGAFYGALLVWAGPVVFHDIVVDPVKYIGPVQHSPLFPPTFGILFVPVELLVLGGPLLLLAAAARQRSARPVVCGLVCLAMLPHFLNTADVSHLFSVACLSIPLLLVGLTDETGLPGSSSAAGRRPGAVLLVATAAVVAWSLVIVFGYGIYLSPLSPLSPQNAGNAASRTVTSPQGFVLASTRAEARDDRQVLAYLNTHASPGARVFVTPDTLHMTYTMTYMYFLLGRPPATPYLELENGVVTRTAVQRTIIRGLRTCRWVVMLRGGDWYAAGAPRHPDMPLDRYIATHYRPVYNAGSYAVLKRRG